MSSSSKKHKKIKLPRTCFVIFRSAQSDDLKKNHPNLSFGDISREIARRWKALSPLGRKKWILKATEEKKSWEREHGSIQEYKQFLAAEQDTPDARHKRELSGKGKYSAYSFFKRTYVKQLKIELRRKREAGGSSSKSGKVDNFTKGQIEELCKAKWEKLAANDRRQYEDKSKKKISEIKDQNSKRGSRWYTAETLEDPVMGKYPIHHVLQFCHCVWKYIDTKTETNMSERERPEQINWNTVSKMLPSFSFQLTWNALECQRVWKYIAYAKVNTPLVDSDTEEISASIGDGDFPPLRIAQARSELRRENVLHASAAPLASHANSNSIKSNDSVGIAKGGSHGSGSSIIANRPGGALADGEGRSPKSPSMDDIRVLALGSHSAPKSFQQLDPNILGEPSISNAQAETSGKSLIENGAQASSGEPSTAGHPTVQSQNQDSDVSKNAPLPPPEAVGGSASSIRENAGAEKISNETQPNLIAGKRKRESNGGEIPARS
jgi:hypothetical protein